MLKAVVLTVNYPEDSYDAAIPSQLSVDQLAAFLKQLLATEKDMTSFVLVAVPANK
jgi:hypothetical protein